MFAIQGALVFRVAHRCATRGCIPSPRLWQQELKGCWVSKLSSCSRGPMLCPSGRGDNTPDRYFRAVKWPPPPGGLRYRGRRVYPHWLGLHSEHSAVVALHLPDLWGRRSGSGVQASGSRDVTVQGVDSHIVWPERCNDNGNDAGWFVWFPPVRFRLHPPERWHRPRSA